MINTLSQLTWSGIFDIYVEDGLLSDIQPALNTYVADLTKEGYQVTVQEFSSNGTAEDLRTQLQSRWLNDGLEGALFVGNLPYVPFTTIRPTETIPTDRDFPHDLYFMDLDGSYQP